MVDKSKTTLIITEKPQAAEKIAAALSGAKDEKVMGKDKVAHYEFSRDGRNYLVGCAVGHLYGIGQKAARGPFPNFEVEWQPSYNKKSSAFTKRYLDNLKVLSKQAGEFIVATDFDVEGEVIGLNVLRFICGQKDAKRMKFSSLTKDELEESFSHLLPNLNWGSAIAGETRHYIDWFYGINLSRGLMKAISSTGKFRILSIGRVQGPALKIVALREKEIKDFKSEPYWQVFLRVRDIRGTEVEVKFPKDIFEERELVKFKFLQGKKGFAKTEVSLENVLPPFPFDLTTLQTEAYRLHGYTPSQTLKIAQDLYLSGAISYPRTSSQKLPSSIGYEKILNKLKKYTTKVSHVVRKIPVEGKKEDPAHPSIYPTGEMNKIPEANKKIYDLIVKRFIACFCSDALIENKKLEVSVDGMVFTAKGLKIKEEGWIAVYPENFDEVDIPTINGDVDVREIRTEEKMTQPPRRYSAASLVKELEKRGLGTKATRANIVETLFSRDYIRGKSIEVTDLGMHIYETLDKYSPIILNEDLTKEMEEELDKIEVASSGYVELEKKSLDDAKKQVTLIARDMEKNLESMGKSLALASDAVIEEQREESSMNACPVCKKGRLRVMFGKKYSRYFVSCDAYPTCKTIYSLPPRGLIKPARDKEGTLEICTACSFPLVVSFQKGRGPWKFCFNPLCSTNEELQKKKEEFKAKLASGQIEKVGGKFVDKTAKTEDAKEKPKKKGRKKDLE